MKTILTIFLFAFFTNSILGADYNANGNSGFGNPIGTSTIAVTDDGSNISLVLTRGSGDFNDFLTIYFDSKTGGFSNTSTFGDFADANRRAISGANSNGRSTVNFPSDFTADYAISFNTVYGGLWELAAGNNNSLNYVKSVGQPASNTFSTFTITLAKSDLGISTSTIGFKFIATYGNPNDGSGYYRSNEGYGSGLPSSNPGVSDVTFTTSKSYPIISTPLNLHTFSGNVQNENSIHLKWETLSETGLNKFIIQKSTNGLNFVNIAEVPAKNFINGAFYDYFDNNLNTGNNFYRVIALSFNNDVATSKVIRILFGKIDNNLTLFPNPTREFLKINFVSTAKGNYNVNIYTDAGQKLLHQTFLHNGIDKIINITLPVNFKKGPYRVIIENDSEFYKGTFIVQ